jgi:tRNA(Ile)-lysidine synthase
MDSSQRICRILESALTELPAGPVAIAFSGGLDSSVLLHALAGSQRARERGLRAIHVDHGLHPQSSDWATHCERFSEDCGIPALLLKARIENRRGLGLEAAARKARYASFAEALGENEILAFAHHQDDQTETVLLKLLRGAGPEGLGAMRELRRLGKAWAWRPLLGIRRDDLRRYAEQAGLVWLDDPSNDDARIDRNYLRHDVLPTLRERWPRADASISQSANWIRAASDFIEGESTRALASLQGLDLATMDFRRWLALPDALRDPVLRRWLRGLRLAEPNRHQVDEIERQLTAVTDDKLPCVRWPGAELRRYRDCIHAMPPLQLPDRAWEQHWDGQMLPLPAALGTLCLEDESGCCPALPEGKRLLVRFRRGGERLRLNPNGYHRDLRDLYQEAGIPPWQRGRIPMVLDRRGELLAVGDLWISDIGTSVFAGLECRLKWNHALTTY